jgi:hypothetical protein
VGGILLIVFVILLVIGVLVGLFLAHKNGKLSQWGQALQGLVMNRDLAHGTSGYRCVLQLYQCD